MYKITIRLFLGWSAFIVCISCLAQTENSPSELSTQLSGPYLGQKPPGITPELFAPGIISTDKYELNSIFSPDGKEFYYSISTTTPEEKAEGKYFYIVMYSKLVDGFWTKPRRAPFSKEYMTTDIAFSPDGNRLYFCTDQSNFDNAQGLDIWYVEREGDSWSEPIDLGAPINTPLGETQPSFTNDGSIYFPSWNPESDDADIYYSRKNGDSFGKPVRLGPEINTKYNEGNSFISPDERYILFARWGMPETMHNGKALFISFKNQDGTWTPAKSVEDSTEMCGSLAALSPDGKYLFYSCNGNIYWVDASIIETLRN